MPCSTIPVSFDPADCWLTVSGEDVVVSTVADYMFKLKNPQARPQPEPVVVARPRMTLRAMLGLQEGLTMSQAFAPAMG